MHGEQDPPDHGSVYSSEEGVYSEDEYRHIKTKLEVGDLVVIYGNGFARSTFPGGGIVGHNRLIEALQDTPHSQQESRLAHLIGLIQEKNPPEEDSTVIVCRVTTTGVRLRDNLLAPLRLLRRPTDHTSLT
jgi:hypothetical protein